LAFGNFLPLTLPNFRLEDQKILVVFPPAFQLIHHLPRWRSANWATICLKRWSSERLFLSRTDQEPGRDLIFTSRSLRRATVSLRAQPFDQRRHLTESGAILGLGIVDLIGRRASLDGVLVGGHGNAERLQYPACFVAWHKKNLRSNSSNG